MTDIGNCASPAFSNAMAWIVSWTHLAVIKTLENSNYFDVD
jgi:hypothetical protein